MSHKKHEDEIVVVSGLGNATGTGAAAARLFAERGFRVALVSRPRPDVDALETEIRHHGGTARTFAVKEYSYKSITDVSCIPFLDITEDDIERSARINIVASTAFAQAATRAFLAEGRRGDKGGSIIMTGATSAWRGKESFGAFAAGKHGLRALSQSLAREYGPHGVHVAFVVIDGTIVTKRTLATFGSRPDKDRDWLRDEHQRPAPESIARTYLYLHEQTPDAWTLEMDLRPAKEKF
ncbi:hypothetical protein JCM11491_006217 [Sporobolomyces phaffii]